jgi:SAM-dependent methyltransferase
VTNETDRQFAGAIPKLYETYLVPLIFEPYAALLAGRLAERPAIHHVLELAAGTGVVTRALCATLPASTSIIATDLNQTMIDHAATLGASRPVTWRQADALQLPFDDGMFDAVVCQFGVMFFPDKARAFAEARRVLRTGGRFLFNVWDRIEENEFADTITAALARRYPTDPPKFLARTPHGYFDPSTINADLERGGFTASPDVVTVGAHSRAASPKDPAVAYCQGTPLRSEIEARDPEGLDEATATAAAAIARRFGHGSVNGRIQAHVIEIER